MQQRRVEDKNQPEPTETSILKHFYSKVLYIFLQTLTLRETLWNKAMINLILEMMKLEMYQLFPHRNLIIS